ncbi:MAG: hypothetical protein ACI39R_05170 [Lachnospiraceae bacterium]
MMKPLFNITPDDDMHYMFQNTLMQFPYSHKESLPRKEYMKYKSLGVLLNKSRTHILIFYMGFIIMFMIVHALQIPDIHILPFFTLSVANLSLTASILYLMIGFFIIRDDIRILFRYGRQYNSKVALLDAMDRQTYLMKDGNLWVIEHDWGIYHTHKVSHYSRGNGKFPFQKLYIIERIHSIVIEPLYIKVIYDGIMREVDDFSQDGPTLIPYREKKIVGKQMLFANCIENHDAFMQALDELHL